MKKNILLSLIFLLLSFGISYAEEITVKFATGEWEPYTSEKLPEYGAVTELVSAVCKAAGIKPEYEFYPWKRAEKMTKDGEVFAVFPKIVTKERKEIFDFSDILFHGANYFVYYNKNPRTLAPVKYEKIEDIRGYKVGIIFGFIFEKELSNAGIKFETAYEIENSIRKLAAGRIDFYLDEQAATYYVINRLFPNEADNFKKLPKMYGDKRPNALLVSRKYPESGSILKKFNEGLELIKKSGEYDRIINKHNMSK
jgi:polar amino acid transport system substrate-binding protein